jgi:hypothetical protein
MTGVGVIFFLQLLFNVNNNFPFDIKIIMIWF